MNDNEVILKVLAEGGSVTLHGRRCGSAWQFSLYLLDQTPLLIDDPMIANRSEIVESWEEALVLLDRYPWHRLHPRTVHPEFRERIWREIQSRYAAGGGRVDRLLRWKEECFGLPRDSLFGTKP